jgi:predicted transcriptional regulator
MSMTSSNPKPRHDSRQCKPVCVDHDATILNVSRLIRNYQTEQLVVTQRLHDVRVPVGIVSACDIVTRIVAAELDPAVMTAGDIIRFDTPEGPMAGNVGDALKALIATGGGLLPLLDSEGALTGFTTLNELLNAMDGNDPA